MNLQSIILLILIILLVFLALRRYIKKDRHSCNCGSCQGCKNTCK